MSPENTSIPVNVGVLTTKMSSPPSPPSALISSVSGTPRGCFHFPHTYFFLRFLKFIFRERGRDGEREGEKH